MRMHIWIPWASWLELYSQIAEKEVISTLSMLLYRQCQHSFLPSLLSSIFISLLVFFFSPDCLSLSLSLSKVCSLLPVGIPLGSLTHTHTHTRTHVCTQKPTCTECIRVAVIYNTAPLSRLNNSYKQTIDMEMERCSSLAGAACFVNG